MEHVRATQNLFLLIRHYIVIIFSVAIFVILPINAYASYSRNITFGTVKITYEELSQIINLIHNYVGKINTSDKSNRVNEKITIGDDKKTYKARFPDITKTLKESQIVSYNATYSLDSNNTNAPITSIQLELRDSYRTLTIEGNESDNVDALFSLLRDEIDKHVILIGGPTFRTIGGLAILFISGVAILFIFSIKEPSNSTGAIVTTSWAVLLITLLVLPFNKWLPGFVLYDLNSSFMVRNSALFTFLSFMAIPIPVFGTLFKKLLKKRKSDEQRTIQLETKIGEAIQKVDDIKKRADVPVCEITNIEADIRKIGEEFFKSRESKMILRKQADFDVQSREVRLNSEWRVVYLFIVNNLIALLQSYNEKLSENEKINYEINEVPTNIFSQEANAYKAKIKFTNGFETIFRLYINRPFKKDTLPTLIFEIDHASDSRQKTRFVLELDPDARMMRIRKDYDMMNLGLNEDKHKLDDDSYKNFILDMFRTVFEHQLVS